MFHRKYDKASNNFSRGKWRNTVGVVSGLVREENKKSRHMAFFIASLNTATFDNCIYIELDWNFLSKSSNDFL